MLVLTRHSDPRTGDSGYRLTNIVRAEPDHSLFIVPPSLHGEGHRNQEGWKRRSASEGK